MFQLEQVKVQAKPLEYLLGNSVFEDFKVTGLRFNSPRAEVGSLITTGESPEESLEGAESAATASKETESEGSGLSIPSSDELLAGTDLQTEIKAKQLQQVWQDESGAIKSIYNDLPDDEAVKQNRLALLNQIYQLFLQVADISRL